MTSLAPNYLQKITDAIIREERKPYSAHSGICGGGVTKYIHASAALTAPVTLHIKVLHTKHMRQC